MKTTMNHCLRLAWLAAILLVMNGFIGTASATVVSDLITNAVSAYKQGSNDLAIADFSQLIRLNVREAYYGRAQVYYQKRDYDRAIADLDEVLQHNPTASALKLRGNAYAKKADYENAGADYSRAIQLTPQDSDLYVGRADCLFYRGDAAHAFADYSQAIQLKTTNALAYAHRGELYAAVKDDYRRGIADCIKSIRLDPHGWLGYNNLAALLSICPSAKIRNGQKALLSARKACELTAWNNSLTMGILAGAYAETGDFNDAINWQEKSMELAMNSGTLAPIQQKKLDLYEHHKPFHAAKN
jgi:tetratricopeptide (TPR) repeat protein